MWWNNGGGSRGERQSRVAAKSSPVAQTGSALPNQFAASVRSCFLSGILPPPAAPSTSSEVDAATERVLGAAGVDRSGSGDVGAGTRPSRTCRARQTVITQTSV